MIYPTAQNTITSTLIINSASVTLVTTQEAYGATPQALQMKY